jgi:hypothetical protein
MIMVSDDCQGVLDLGFVIDSSGSIQEKDPGNWDILLKFVRDVINRFTIGEQAVRVGAVVYSNNVRVAVDLRKQCKGGIGLQCQCKGRRRSTVTM